MHPENKAHREEITKRKWYKRLFALGLKPEEGYPFKHQGRPCSCFMCSHLKYSRKVKHKKSK